MNPLSRPTQQHVREPVRSDGGASRRLRRAAGIVAGDYLRAIRMYSCTISQICMAGISTVTVAVPSLSYRVDFT